MLRLPSTLLHYRDLLTASNHWGLEAQKNEICTRLRWWLFEKAAAEIAAQVLTDNIGLLCYAVFLSKSCEHWCCIFVHSAFPLKRTLRYTALPVLLNLQKSMLAFSARRCFFSKQTEMVQRCYAYAISPLDNYEWTMRHRPLWLHRYLDWKCYYVYSYLRKN